MTPFGMSGTSFNSFLKILTAQQVQLSAKFAAEVSDADTANPFDTASLGNLAMLYWGH